MKKLLIFAALVFTISLTSTNSYAQKVYDLKEVKVQPGYPGGTREFYSYLAKSIKYPAEARKNNVQGKVFLSFIVEKDGQLSNVTVIKGLSKETDIEAKRVIKASPKWNPAIINNKPVRVKYVMNVNFTLS